jgi:hypothetical protein
MVRMRILKRECKYKERGKEKGLEKNRFHHYISKIFFSNNLKDHYE